MCIEEQVLSIDQMQYLEELGLKIEGTALAWFPPYKYDADGFPSYLFREKDSYSIAFNDGDEAATPTLTLQEILEMLPEEIKFEGQRAFLIIDKSERMISYTAENYIDCMFFGNENLLEAAYKMLCWCLKQGHIKNE